MNLAFVFIWGIGRTNRLTDEINRRIVLSLTSFFEYLDPNLIGRFHVFEGQVSLYVNLLRNFVIILRYFRFD